MTLKQSAEQDFLNKLAHRCVPLLHSTKLSSHVMCPDKDLGRNGKNRHLLLIFLLGLIKDLYRTNSSRSVCMYYDTNL